MRKLRLSLLVAMLVIVTAASAQLNLGIKGGLNMSNMVGDKIDDSNMKLGFHAGIAADYEFMPSMALQTGLFFSTKGAKANVVGNTDASINSMYLQVPVHFAYKLDATPGTRIVFHAGPYVAYGVGGKVKVGDKNLADVFGDKGFFKAFDAGLGLGVGAEFGPILVDVGWDMGLVNIANKMLTDLGGKARNQNAYLSVGYKF